MIVLERLRVRALKHLRDIDLWFPRRGSVLIEGQNESGKSTLFEAIYFALYGSPLVSEDGVASLLSLVPHGETSAAVTLNVLVGDTRLEVSRRLSAASKRQRHEARLIVRHPNGQTEDLAQVSAVNERILQEMHGLDGATLRNSCFMEQKALDRLEQLSRADRESAVARLLGLDRLVAAERELTPTREDRDALARLREQQNVAARRGEARAARDRVSALEEQLRAARARAEIARRDALGDSREGAGVERQRLVVRQSELEECAGRVERLRSAAASVRLVAPAVQRARVAYESAAAARTRVEALRDLSERELPEAAAMATRLTKAEDILRESLRREQEATDALASARNEIAASEALDQAERRLAEASDALHEAEHVAARAESVATLEALVRAWRAQGTAADGFNEMEQVEVERRASVAAVEVAGRRTRAAQVRTLALVGVAVVCAALTTLERPVLVVAAIALLAAAFCGWQWSQAASALRVAIEKLNATDRRLIEQKARLEAARQYADGVSIASLQEKVRVAGITVPASIDEAEASLRRQIAAGPVLPSEAALAQRTVREAVATVAAAEHARAAARERLERARATRGAAHESPEALQSELDAAVAATAEARQAIEAMGLAPDVSAVVAARGGAEAEVLRLRAALRDLPEQERRLAERETEFRGVWSAAAAELTRARADADATGVAVEVAFPEMPSDPDVLDAAQRVLLGAVERDLASLDTPELWRELADVRSQLDRLTSDADAATGDYGTSVQRIRQLCAEAGFAVNGDEALEHLLSRWPELAHANAQDVAGLEEEVESVRRDALVLERTIAELASRAGVAVDDIDEMTCAEQVAEAERTLRRCELAAGIAREAWTEIVRRVLPETQEHMRAILPELTAGRYADVELLRGDDGANAADLRIRVWDAMAGRYVAKNLFSGGTRDQCSLALRLAFALATLPKELGAVPGFIFLDEPLSAFDAERSRALVTLLTDGAIAEHFDQIVLISHSQAVRVSSFQYTVRMAQGRVERSTLPEGAEAEALWSVESSIRSEAAGV